MIEKSQIKSKNQLKMNYWKLKRIWLAFTTWKVSLSLSIKGRVHHNKSQAYFPYAIAILWKPKMLKKKFLTVLSCYKSIQLERLLILNFKIQSLKPCRHPVANTIPQNFRQKLLPVAILNRRKMGQVMAFAKQSLNLI